jgi:hypothetical protein
MNSNQSMTPVVTVAAIALMGSSQVMAQKASPDVARAQSVTSTATRADVKAADIACRATGEPSVFSSEFSNQTQTVATSVPRATVKAETLRALQNDEMVDGGEVFSVRAPNASRAMQLAGLGR